MYIYIVIYSNGLYNKFIGQSWVNINMNKRKREWASVARVRAEANADTRCAHIASTRKQLERPLRRSANTKKNLENHKARAYKFKMKWNETSKKKAARMIQQMLEPLKDIPKNLCKTLYLPDIDVRHGHWSCMVSQVPLSGSRIADWAELAQWRELGQNDARKSSKGWWG